jgi:2-haloacid dehalogenase
MTAIPDSASPGASGGVRPVTIFFDVNETLTDLTALADAFDDVGAHRLLAATWFSTVLRDGFALTSAQSEASFAVIARSVARDLLDGSPLDCELDTAVDAVMEAFARVPLHADVADGIRTMHNSGHRLFTLSNGPTANIRRLLGEAGLLEDFEDLLSVEGHSPWKPARDSYTDALSRTGTHDAAYLVAVHPWDIHGATVAGMSTVWVNRSGGLYPGHFLPPTVEVTTIGELAHTIGLENLK